jgi:hypothetical protein
VPTAPELQPLVTEPREDIGVEYKEWLDPTSNHGRATIARAAIALANHGGGFIVIGFAEQKEALVSQTKPDNLQPSARAAPIVPALSRLAISSCGWRTFRIGRYARRRHRGPAPKRDAN